MFLICDRSVFIYVSVSFLGAIARTFSTKVRRNWTLNILVGKQRLFVVAQDHTQFLSCMGAHCRVLCIKLAERGVRVISILRLHTERDGLLTIKIAS